MNALPQPVARFRQAVAEQLPTETVEIRTKGSMRRPGTPRIPLEIVMYHRLGRDFVHDIRVGRGRASARFGLDAYVDGRGLMKVGPKVFHGTNFDQGALIAMWAEVLGWPSAWESRADVRWEPVDERTAVLIVPGPEGEIPITVAFDPVTWLPASFSADRYKSEGPKVRWTGTSGAWQRFGNALAPRRFEARWADEPAPWIEIETVDVRRDVDVSHALELARAALQPMRPVHLAALVAVGGGTALLLALRFIRARTT